MWKRYASRSVHVAPALTNRPQSRLGLALVVRLLREARLQTLPFPSRMMQGQDGSGESPSGSMLAGGKRWSYSDIHAAAIASSSSFTTTSTTTTSTSDPPPTSGSALFPASIFRGRSRQGSPSPEREHDGDGTTSRSNVNRLGEDVPAPPAANTNTGGWSSWLW